MNVFKQNFNKYSGHILYWNSSFLTYFTGIVFLTASNKSRNYSIKFFIQRLKISYTFNIEINIEI